MIIDFQIPSPATPIWEVMLAAPNAIAAIAPERTDELMPRLRKLQLTFSNDNAYAPYCRPNEQSITIDSGFVEGLWCASYAYNAFRKSLEHQVATSTGDGPKMRLDHSLSNPEINYGVELLREAVDAAISKRPIDWNSAPRPSTAVELSLGSSLVEKTGEMTRFGLAFVIHHELAHIYLNHIPQSEDQTWTLEQEKDADSGAIEWVLGSLPPQSTCDAQIAKRLCAVVFVTSFLTAIGLAKCSASQYSSRMSNGTHPQPYDQLDKAVKHNTIQSNEALTDFATSTACAALLPAIRLANISLAKSPYYDFPSLYEECLNQLSLQFVS